jgi:CHAT domain
LNSCDTGDGGFYLTNLGGWAHDFLDAGAGAFLGTLWPVNDRIAREFAKDFYRRFLSGYSIAEALLQARLHVRDLIPGDPSWLAYTVFAHPFANALEIQGRLSPRNSAGQNNLDVGTPPTRERVHTTNPPDIRIHAHHIFLDGQVHLEFQLDSPSRALDLEHYQLSGSLPLGTPEEYRLRWRRLNDRLEKLNDGLDLGDEILLEEHIKDKLDGIGRELYHALFPPEIKQAYRSFRKRGLSLMLITDEPSIPWELIKPYDDSDLTNFIDDGFLGLEFPMTRWLASTHAPAKEVLVQRFAFLGGEAFPRSRAERQQLYTLAGKYSGVEDVSPNEPTMEAFEKLLDGSSVDLIHFAGPFTDRAFRPEDLHGPRTSKIRRNRPLVIFNYQDGLKGWEHRWIENSGCGAFVGLSWPPKDSLAYEFIATFYNALGRGQTFGYATLESRRRVSALSPGSPTWLAYTVYAHPNSRIVLGGARSQ